MDFQTFKETFLKEEVIEYTNDCHLKQPLVSVRVLAYRHLNYISRCLDSILMQQTSFDFDIVIAEDDSDDGTREICIKYAKKYPDRIRLLLNSRRNNIEVKGKPTGIFNSVYSNFSINSKYIALCEADDYWTDPRSLQSRVQYLEENDDHVMSFHNALWTEQDDAVINGRPYLSLKESTSIQGQQFINLRIATASILYRNHLIRKFDMSMSKIMVGDILLLGKLSQFGKGRYLHEITPSIYTVHAGGSFSGLDFEQKLSLSIEARKHLLDALEDLKYRPALLQHVSLLYLTMFFKFLYLRKRIRMKLLIESMSYARQSEIGFMPVVGIWYRKNVQLRNKK